MINEFLGLDGECRGYISVVDREQVITIRLVPVEGMWQLRKLNGLWLPTRGKHSIDLY